MRVLIHARLRGVFESIRETLEAHHHQVTGAFSVEEGSALMTEKSYDKVFIGIGVSAPERLTLMTLAGELGMSMIEIIDADTVVKEMLMHSPTGKHPSVSRPPPSRT